MLSFVLGGFLLVSASSALPSPDCLPWEEEKLTGNQSQVTCKCRSDLPHEMRCSGGRLYLNVNRCLTYSNSTLYEASCPYTKTSSQIDPNTSSVVVPTDVLQINDSLCGPLNRQGLVCSECKEGYGVSVLTGGSLRCTPCSASSWRGWLLYLTLQLVPLTVFYVVIFMFQISVTSSPMKCFVFYGQILIGAFAYDEIVVNEFYVQSTPPMQKVFKILVTLYEPWNLEFLTHLLPDFCLSPGLRGVHVCLLRYLPSLHCLLLVTVTYYLLKLDNFRCQLPWLQRLLQPLRHCVGSLRSTWSPQASVVDVIATLFLLAFNRLLLNSMLIMRYSHLKDVSASPPLVLRKVLHIDPTVPYLGEWHMLSAIPAFLALPFLFVMVLFLGCYTLGPFQRALGCLASIRMQQRAHVFVEKLQGHYKDGTGNTRDMRLFSVHYLLLRFVLILVSPFVRVPGSITYAVRGTILILSSILVLAVRPYKVEHLSVYDGLLLALLGVQALLVNVKIFLRSPEYARLVLVLSLVTMALPQLVLVSYVTVRVLKSVSSRCKGWSLGWCKRLSRGGGGGGDSERDCLLVEERRQMLNFPDK